MELPTESNAEAPPNVLCLQLLPRIVRMMQIPDKCTESSRQRYKQDYGGQKREKTCIPDRQLVYFGIQSLSTSAADQTAVKAY